MKLLIRLSFLTFLAVCPLFLRAAAATDKVDVLVQQHLKALGGKDRVAALKAMRATGNVIAGGKKMRFTLLAVRPNLVRLETEQDTRTLVQGTDGKNAPWEFDTGEWPPRYRDMAQANAKTFASDSEYDDPLVGGAQRGYKFEYAGTVNADGRKLPRILVTRGLTETFSLLLDPDTMMIIRRIEEHKGQFGGTILIVTQFDDYRSVEGVMVPFKVAMAVDGKVKQRTEIDKIEANPEYPADSFSRPLVGAKAK